MTKLTAGRIERKIQKVSSEWKRAKLREEIRQHQRNLAPKQNWRGFFELSQKEAEIRRAKSIAEKAGQFYQHTWRNRGDHLYTTILDFVFPPTSLEKPYFDMGNKGLVLVEVERTRIYAKSWRYGPSVTSTKYLVGRNENGNYFAHSVVNACNTVKQALAWMWNNQEMKIIQRQGDIALIEGSGKKIPISLPNGHKVKDNGIFHETHPFLPLPGKGQKIIIAKRASVRVSEATRD